MPSDPRRWARVKRLFERASELPPPERGAFLDRETGDDPELRAEVEGLLAADGDASAFLETLPEGLIPTPSPGRRWVGQRFGAYEVVEELGRGGTGVVLLGRRADGHYDREVALKVVPASLLQGHLESRFRAEVRILADLDHPNIAGLLDAGETAEGLAYLVMEYVDGPRLDVFADERSLDVRGRLRLFRAVLDGVDYAHARGVIHRDLKPSNILVTGDGTPKLVDFGIAKLLDPPGPDEATRVETRTGQRMMTPEYASPEQVRGEAVDPRSDVYALGVVLYRLLTGRAPYRLDPTEPRSAERVILESSPSRPSDAVARTVPVTPATAPEAPPLPDADVLARQRSSTRDRLRRSLRGDLDTIVLHALAKEPARRYGTAGAFADDIDRYLAGEAIRARTPGIVYRTRRFVRRRWLPLAASVAALAGISAVAWQAEEARTQRRAAEVSSTELTGLVESVLTTLNTDMAGLDEGPTATRAAAVEAAVASLDSVASRAGGRPGPELLRALASGYQEVGRIQGHPTSSNLGRVDDARESLRTSLGLWRRFAEARPEDVGARFEAVETQVLLADIHRMRGENRRAGALLDSAQATMDSLRATEEPDIPLLSTLAMVYERQANQAEAAGDAEATAAYVSEMSELARRTARLTPEGPARVGALEEVVLALQAESWVHSKLARSEEAIRVQRRAAELADSLADLPGTTQRMEGIRAGAWSQLGWRYNDADRPDEAEAAFTRAVDVLREMVEGDARNQAAIAALGQALEGRGQARIRGERWAAALDDHREAVDLLSPLLETLPATAFMVAQAHRQAGEAHTRLGRYARAETAYDSAVSLARGLLERDTAFAPARKILALAHLSRALHHRLRVEATGDPAPCPAARREEEVAWNHWGRLRDRGQVTPGEERIWSDFLDMMPEGVCTAPDP